ncbi:MAG: hypothetical protein ACRDLV_06625 [Solirubrobacteraceae bacterium]
MRFSSDRRMQAARGCRALACSVVVAARDHPGDARVVYAPPRL